MVTRVIVVIVACLCCCAWQTEPEPYREKLSADVVADLLVEEYTTRYGDLARRCEEHLHNVAYVGLGYYVDESDAVMGRDDRIGEHLYTEYGSYIWVDNSLSAIQYNKVLVHEQIHALLACESDTFQQGVGDGDGDHNKAGVWCTDGKICRFDGNDDESSLEYAVAEMVRYWTVK